MDMQHVHQIFASTTDAEPTFVIVSLTVMIGAIGQATGLFWIMSRFPRWLFHGGFRTPQWWVPMVCQLSFYVVVVATPVALVDVGASNIALGVMIAGGWLFLIIAVLTAMMGRKQQTIWPQYRNVDRPKAPTMARGAMLNAHESDDEP